MIYLNIDAYVGS